MTRDEAARLLSLSPTAEDVEVRSAYARAVKADHPDQGGAGTLIAQLKQARDVMLCHSEIVPCNHCRGVGYIRGRFGARACMACGGSGETK